MTPSPIHTHAFLTLPTSAPGSVEAWFAMPALWIIRRESAAAHPVPRKKQPRLSERDTPNTGRPTLPSPHPSGLTGTTF